MVASLFDKEPMHWGLRGDPYLWKQISAHFEQTPLPDSADELISLIETTFERLTGHSISEREMFFIERFSHGACPAAISLRISGGRKLSP